MQWDHYEFNIANHFASAIINGDYSGLDDEEERQLNAFLAECDDAPHGWTIGHWTIEDDTEAFRHCEVCGSFADTSEFRLHIYK